MWSVDKFGVVPGGSAGGIFLSTDFPAQNLEKAMAYPI